MIVRLDLFPPRFSKQSLVGTCWTRADLNNVSVLLVEYSVVLVRVILHWDTDYE